MVIAFGLTRMHPDLILITRDRQGETESRKILGVAFVPLIESPWPFALSRSMQDEIQ